MLNEKHSSYPTSRMFNQQKLSQSLNQTRKLSSKDKNTRKKKESSSFQSIFGESITNINQQISKNKIDKNEDVKDTQTDPFIEDLTNFDKVLAASTQTETFSSDQESEVNFVCSVDQIDQTTQLDLDELRNFDEEVIPIVEVLMGNAITKAIEELEKEDELAELEEIRRIHNEKVEEKLKEINELEEIHQKMVLKKEMEESKIRLEQKEYNLRREKEQTMKFAKSFVSKIRWSAINYIKSIGWFKDVNKSVEEYVYQPYIRKQFYKKGIETYNMARILLDEMIKDSFDYANSMNRNLK